MNNLKLCLVHFSEDLHTEDQIFTSPKMEVKDTDQEVEEEVSSPSHQPSVFAKFVFVLLFSALVVSMSFVFISLQGTHSEFIWYIFYMNKTQCRFVYLFPMHKKSMA